MFTCLRVYVFTQCFTGRGPSARPGGATSYPPGGEGETRGGADTGTKPVAPDSASPLGKEGRTAWASPWKPPGLLCMQLSAHNKPSN